jgi:hypothetical protein
MKKIINITTVLLLLLLLFSCKPKPAVKTDEIKIAREYYSDGKIKTETQVKDTSANGLRKNYDKDGNLISVYTFKMSKLEGAAVSYYPNGRIKLKMFYKDGRREGITQWNYITGELYRNIPYKNGRINDTVITYFKNGKIMAEAPYLDDFPGTGLKEYNIKGELLPEDNEIILREDNRLFAENKFVLYVSLKKPKPAVQYFLGELTEGKYQSQSLWEMPVKDGVAFYNLSLEKGRFRMETLVFSAVYKTAKSNYRVVSREYNLAIDNK